MKLKPMSPKQFKKAAETMGMTVTEMGEMLGLAEASWKRYASGQREKIPAYVAQSVRAHVVLFNNGLLEEARGR